MKFGLRYCNTGPYVEPGAAIELIRSGEEAGFESAWTVEHTVVPANYASPYPYAANGKMAGGVDDIPLPDPLIWMAYVASATTTIKLATGILILPQHNPVVVAKQIASLDYMSRGRMICGIGVGWLKEEFDALGVPFERRGERCEEYIQALRALWGDDIPNFNGEFVSFENAYCRPQPLNKNVPIIIGGQSKAAARRAGRVADGFFPGREAPADLIALAKSSAIEAGRDPNEIEITAGMPNDLKDLNDYARLGITRVLVPVSALTGLDVAISSPEDALSWKSRIEDFAYL
ncbi:MAG: LLM class F420-dependent oxidoreductase [Pseudomonadota bacterium]